MGRPARLAALHATFGAGVSTEAWSKPDLLATRLAALTASETEMRSLVGELGVCPYRSGYLGASVPVLPSPDELVYVTTILARVSACVAHALSNLQVEDGVVCA